MKAALKKKILIFITKELLHLNPVKLSASEARMNLKGNRTLIHAKDEKDIKFSIRIDVINTYPESTLIQLIKKKPNRLIGQKQTQNILTSK